ncbi:MAG: ABC transporter ATP-binding protein [Candidatus Sericytochromatia bacterium]|nr:ABC transporter ATP-binding protein [Candidatus Sericytochromatia bacterium]
MIIVKNLEKDFGDFKAVNKISFEVKSGEIFGLLGPNGAGKTTTLRMIAGLITLSGGEIEVCGYKSDQSYEIKRNIGFLTGSTALYGRLTPVEMLEYFGTLNFMPDKLKKQRIDELITLFRMEEFKDKWCQKLSTGQKQRVSIARTILHNPPVLIFDEPTSGLDIISGQIILDFIKDAKKEGKTIIFSTHNMSEAEFLCDTLGLVYRGNIIAKGTIDELKEMSQEKTLREAFLTLLNRSEIAYNETKILHQ